MAKAARSKRQFVCRECGGASGQWAGQCGECGAWNSMEEQAATSGTSRTAWSGSAIGGVAPTPLGEVEPRLHERTATGIGELDRVLGGGIVPGAVVLIGGDPGIGKSTLLMQVVARLALDAGPRAPAGGAAPLYVSGEESLEQVALRARRLGLGDAKVDLLAETLIERILGLAEHSRPSVLVIDSVQTVYTERLQSAPGSVAQVRESAAALTRFAKQSGTSVLLVGHVTKEGALAGPRVLEHMVDTVLYFEAEGNERFRAVRAVKNRFGAANELGIFAMTETGLKPVSNPSAIFLSRDARAAPGSVVTVAREGTRPLLLELQALVDDSQLAAPRRVAVGVDAQRLAMLLAVLHRHGDVDTLRQDVFLNVVGGVRISETSADLASLLAVRSSLRNRALPDGLVVFGEVGLSGEVRPVFGGEERIAEARKHGFDAAIVPAGNAPRRAPKGMQVKPVRRLFEAFEGF